MKRNLQNGPFTVDLASQSTCFMFHNGKDILTTEMIEKLGCDKEEFKIDHSVVVVGLKSEYVPDNAPECRCSTPGERRARACK